MPSLLFQLAYTGSAPFRRRRVCHDVPEPSNLLASRALRTHRMHRANWRLQVFRELRPSVEALLEGRKLEFCGMLEAEADGLGVFKADPDLCAVTLVGDINVAPFLRLLKGEFGSSPLTGIVIAVNPWWTQSSAIGNPWQTGLRRDAARLLDDGGWKPLYYLEAVSSKSDMVEGSLLFCYPYTQWMVYDIAGHLLGEFDNKPAGVKVLELLLASK
ncbi:hypothetical protein CYMTET_48316 [Cymbomonas tetramitiformis]|uniref:DUF1995 domain-containing protein n=1 Tax=Cymbomonas tetramitiformis TaxID=36881 RepID=A0AAE0EWW3_9CHLO|nr:hypothetical protein CYMTET_48316 [Cymbomonas tetramitiformis]